MLSTSIRNFLTLFLSIEVSKAAQELMEARLSRDTLRESYAEKRVQCFTDQLNDSNPILNEISDAMTEEGDCKAAMDAAILRGDDKAARVWEKRMTSASVRKQEGNAKLMECSARYSRVMKAIRQASDSMNSLSAPH